jgi:hypothetical protein
LNLLLSIINWGITHTLLTALLLLLLLLLWLLLRCDGLLLLLLLLVAAAWECCHPACPLSFLRGPTAAAPITAAAAAGAVSIPCCVKRIEPLPGVSDEGPRGRQLLNDVINVDYVIMTKLPLTFPIRSRSSGSSQCSDD